MEVVHLICPCYCFLAGFLHALRMAGTGFSGG